MSRTIEMTQQHLAETVATNDIVVLDFWADWCGPCKAFAPVFADASERHTDVVFAKVDTEAEPELSNAFGVRSIPTIVVIREGIPVFSRAGALPGHALDELIEQVRTLDIDAVRADLA